MEPVPHEPGYVKTPLDHSRPLLDPEQQSAPARSTASSEKASRASGSRQQPRSALLSWKVQFFSWTCSLLFFIAIVVVLRVLDGRTPPNTKIGITPNAIVGLLATFLELSLVVPVNSAVGQIKWLRALRTRQMHEFRTIDEASRGPWGSVLLLARRSGGFTASIGALVTIFALGINVFSQQALRYEATYPFSDDAWMPTAQFMNGSVTGIAPLGRLSWVEYFDTELLASPYAAFYQRTNGNMIATAHCGTGNCTWEPYLTLAVCNTCIDLSPQLKRTHIDANKYGFRGTDYYTLPNEFGLFGTPPWDKRSSDPLYETAILNITTARTGSVLEEDYEAYHNWTSIAFPNNGSKLLNIFAVGLSPGTIPKEPDANDTNAGQAQSYAAPVAYECLLQFCVRNLSAIFSNGTLRETEISTYIDQNWQPGRRNGKNPGPPMVIQPPGAQKSYVVEDAALGTTSHWLSEVLRGNATRYDGERFRSQSSPTKTSSDIVQSIYLAMNKSTTGFPNLIESLAQSLSISLRDISYQPQRDAVGKAFTIGNHAVVRWPWLILPAVELLASLVFLVAVMLETKKAGMVPWTNNPLAYFFHGFDQRPLRGNDYKTQRIMEKEARGLMVEFRKHEDGGRLVVVDDTSS